MPEDLETRTVLTPRTGTKICILIGLALIIAAVYFYFVPVTAVRTTSGSVFGCGSAAHPASSTFAHNTCWRSTDVEKYRAIAAGALAIVTIIIGAVMFGVDRRTETGRPRHTIDSYDDARRDRSDAPRHGSAQRDADEDRDARDDRDRADRDRTDRVQGNDGDRDRDHQSVDRDGDNDGGRDQPRRTRRRRDWDDDRA